MKNQKSFIIAMQLPVGLNCSRVWLCISPIIRRLIDVVPNLETSINQKRVTLSFDDLDCFFSGEHQENSFLVTSEDFSASQMISYAEIDGKLRIGFPSAALETTFRELISQLLGVQFVINTVVQDFDYKSSFLQSQEPPNSNLFIAPALLNNRNGYIEGVSADMWFGDSFWQYAACTKQDVLDCSWLKCEERDNHLYVQAWPQPFSSAEGEQGEIQRKLLKLLFNIDENRPHGGDSEEKPRIFSQSVVIDEEGSVVGRSPLREGSSPPPIPKMPPPHPPNRSNHDD